MATLSLNSRRGLDGLKVRPVARVRVVEDSTDADRIDYRLTLRSDGSIVRQDRYCSGYRAGQFAAPVVWAQVPTGPKAPTTVEDAVARFAPAVTRYISRRYTGLTVTVEALR